MARCSFLTLILLSFISLASAQDNGAYEQRVRDMVGFLQYLLNTVGDQETNNRDKDVIINESYNKIFRDAQVQIEDDLLEDRQSVINKDIVAYLKDVDFFFRDVTFEFDIVKVERLTRDNGQPYFRIELNRTLDALSIEGKKVNNTRKRFIEINLDQASDELKIASIYTTKISKEEELQAWWSELSYEWTKIFKVILNTNEEVSADMLYKIAAIDSLNLAGNQYIFNIEPLYILTNLRYLNISETKISDLGPLRSAGALETLVATQSEIYELEYLKYLRNLVRLDVSNTRIRSVGVIDQFTSLTDLDLSGNYISDFNSLRELRGLAHLDLSNTAFSSTSMLSELNVLTSLNLSNTLISDIGGLRSMNLLKELDLSKTDISNIELLGTLSALQNLNINQTNVASLSPLAQLKNLKRIYCDNTKVSESEATSFMTKNKGVLVINNSQRVLQWWDELDYSWKTILGEYVGGNTQQPGREDLVMLLNIDSLNLRKSKLSTAEPLRRFYKLRYLDISENNINILDPLINLDKLEVLKASSTWVEQVAPIKDLKTLTHLDLSQTRINEIYILSYLGNLKHLNVDGTPVSWEAIREFHLERPDCQIIFDTKYLSNWWDQLEPGWKDIFRQNTDFRGAPDAIQLHQIISQRSVSINQSSISDLRPLWDFLSLEELHIQRSSLSDLSALPALTSLEILELKELPIEDISPIGTLTGLKQLNISSTAIDDLRPLAGLRNLEVLNCSGTNLRNLRGLESLTSLVRLDCSNTRVNRLDQLFELDHLSELSCYNTRLNNRDISSFRGFNPDCKIVYY